MQRNKNHVSADWRDWENFCRIALAGNFTAASERTGLATSSLSASITRLEKHLGMRLFERTTRRVTLTEAGLELYPRAAALFESLRNLEDEATSSSQEVKGTVRISAFYEASSFFLSSILSRILRENENLRIELIDDSGTSPNIIGQGYDVAIMKASGQLPDSSAVSRRLLSITRGLYAAPQFLKKNSCLQDPKDLSKVPVIADDDDDQWTLIRSGNEAVRIPVTPIIRTQNSEIRLRVAMDGLGIVRLAPDLFARDIRERGLIRIFPDYVSSPVVFYVITPTRRLTPPKVKVFLDAIEKMDLLAPPTCADL